MIDKTHILLFALLLTFLPARANYTSQATTFRSTSTMRWSSDVNTYQNSYYSNDTGIRSVSIKNYNSLSTTNGSMMRSYGSGYSVVTATQMQSRQFVTPASVQVSSNLTVPRVSVCNGEIYTDIESNIFDSDYSSFSSSKTRFFAPGTGAADAQWSSWWNSFESTQRSKTVQELTDWWYANFGKTAAPDGFQDFLDWCKKNGKLTDEEYVPLTDGVVLLLLLCFFKVLSQLFNNKYLYA